MNDADARALRRAAYLLLAVSTVRWGWQQRPGPRSAPGTGGDTLPVLLAASRELAEEGRARSRPLGPGERIDPNRASEAELDRLPGIGPAAARALVASRSEDGPFVAPADLARVRGIGPATVARLAPHLDLSELPPTARLRARRGVVELNRATAAELEALPGIGPSLAARIVAARTERPFDSVDDLLRVRGVGPATLARLRPRVAAGARR